MRLSLQKFANNNSVLDPNKPDVVFIHGTGANGTLWQPQIELLTAKGFRCFVPELRGHGATEEPAQPTNLNVYIQDLFETLSQSDIKFPAIWIGHSLGAIILMQWAQEKPELFAQILAVGLPGKVPKIVTSLFSLFMLTPFEILRGTFIHRKLPKRQRVLIDTQRFSLEQIVANFADINLVEKKHQIKCPVHFCVGRFDVVAPYMYVKRIHATLPNSTFKLFEFAGHNCMDSQTEQFNQWVLEKVQESSKSTFDD